MDFRPGTQRLDIGNYMDFRPRTQRSDRLSSRNLEVEPEGLRKYHSLNPKVLAQNLFGPESLRMYPFIGSRDFRM